MGQKIFLGIAGVVLYIVYSLFIVPNFASAVSYPNCQNGPECGLDRSTLSATPWFSVPGSSFHNVGGTFQYNPADVNPTVTVVFRGSYFYNNPYSRQIDVYSTSLGCNVKGTYCNNVNASGGSTGGGGTGVFSSINTADYFRGTSIRKPNMYTNSGTHWDRESKINLNSVPGFSKNSTGVQNLKIPVYSRIRWSGDLSGYGTGNWTTISIKVQAKPRWVLSPSTTVNKTKMAPGETATWTHKVTNDGPSSTNAAATGAGGANEDGKDVTYTSKPWSIASGLAKGNSSSRTSTYKAKDSDLGKSICRYTTIGNYAWNQTGWTGWKDGKCVSVPYNYNLTPTISPLNDVIEAGTEQTVTTTGNISNSGPTRSNTGDWELSRLVFSKTPTSSQKSMIDNSSKACSLGVYNSNKKSCQVVKSGKWSNSIAVNGNYNSGIKDDFLTGGEAFGTSVCYVLSIKPYSVSSSNWRHSKMECITYSKKPKVQVWGGDLVVGRSFSGQSSKVSKVNTSLSSIKKLVRPGITESEMQKRMRNTQRYWLFGKGAALDFGVDNNTVSSLKTSIVMGGDEGISVATSSTGSYVFSTDGMKIYLPDGSIMKNGSDLGSTSTTTQAGVIFPLSNQRYMVVVSSARSETSSLGKLLYSIIDMKAESGKGAVVIKAQPLGKDGDKLQIGESLSAAPNASNDGYWVVVNRPGTAVIRSVYVPYDWNIAGVKQVDTTAGSYETGSNGSLAPGFGTINFSKDYSKIVATGRRNSSASEGYIRVLNFNQSTGTVSQQYVWTTPSGGQPYSADFSPEGKYVYYTDVYSGVSNGEGRLYRFSISGKSDSSAVLKSLEGIAINSGSALARCGSDAYGGGGQVRRAPNDKMYVARRDCNYVGVVNSPDAAKSSMGWNRQGQTLASGVKSSFGLPQTPTVLEINDKPDEFASRSYGSWGEYALVSNGYVKGMASGAGFNHPDGASSNAQDSWSKVTFANIFKIPAPSGINCTSTNKWGCYTHKNAYMPNVESLFSTGSNMASGTVNTSVSGLIKNTVHKKSGGTINLGGGTLGKGQWIVINAPTSTVNITSNIRYADVSLSKANDIPQLVIIANNINIAPGVTNVDSWLISKNALATCNEVGDAASLTATGTAYNLSSNQCGNALRVNGPVMAKKLWLRRTAGAGSIAQAGEPAEVFNYRPDAMLWLNNQLNKKALRTTNIKELPPRY